MSAYSVGDARYARHMCRWVVHAIVRYGHWLQVRNYQSSVSPPMSSALSSHMLCLECIVRMSALMESQLEKMMCVLM